MRKPHVTAERLRELFNYDPETGHFTRRVGRGPSRAGSIAGCKDTAGYIVIRVDWRLYRANRLAWLYVHGSLPDLEIDHINRVPADNRIDNLRPVTNQRNQLNMVKPKRGNALGVLGVYRHQGRFASSHIVDGKTRFLGSYDTVEEASAAYRAAKTERDPEAVLVP